MVNAQEKSDKKYPIENRDKVKIWTARWTYLEGPLNLNNFINLEQLYCDRGELTSLDVSNCSKLTHIHCQKTVKIWLF